MNLIVNNEQQTAQFYRRLGSSKVGTQAVQAMFKAASHDLKKDFIHITQTKQNSSSSKKQWLNQWHAIISEKEQAEKFCDSGVVFSLAPWYVPWRPQVIWQLAEMNPHLLQVPVMGRWNQVHWPLSLAVKTPCSLHHTAKPYPERCWLSSMLTANIGSSGLLQLWYDHWEKYLCVESSPDKP